MGGGGRGATNETMDLCQGVVGSQQITWLSIGGGGGGGGYRRDHGSLSGAGGATEETMGLYQGWGGGGYRRDHGSLSGGGGLQTRPWVSIGGRGATGETMRLYNGRGGGKTDTVGLFKWVGGYKRRPSSPLILVGPELV